LSREDYLNITPTTGALLRLASQAHRERMYAGLAAAGYPGVTPGQFALLRWPSIDNLRPTEVAELTGLSKQTINDVLGEFERNGYIERVRHPDDARGRIVRLTEDGWRLQHATHQISQDLEDGWLEQFGPERLGALREMLEEILSSSSDS
jgi:DNA-binding MarR family transcriptional regulator